MIFLDARMDLIFLLTLADADANAGRLDTAKGCRHGPCNCYKFEVNQEIVQALSLACCRRHLDSEQAETPCAKHAESSYPKS